MKEVVDLKKDITDLKLNLKSDQEQFCPIVDCNKNNARALCPYHCNAGRVFQTNRLLFNIR